MKKGIIYLITTLALVFGLVGSLSTIWPASAAHLAAPSGVTWTDDFTGPSLDSRWSWIREDPDYWSLSANPGYLRLTTQATFSDVNNILVQPAPQGDYELQTRLVFDPTQNFQIAGLVIYQDDSNLLTFGRAYCEAGLSGCVGNGIYFDDVENGSPVGGNFSMTTTVQDIAYLKVVRHANDYTGYVSTDGSNWTLVGKHTVTITPALVGLKTSNQTNGDAEIPANFDYFTLIDKSDTTSFINTDGFDAPPLDGRWSWIREDPTRWSLSADPGYLRLTTQDPYGGVNNILVQPAPLGDYEIQTRLIFSPTQNFQVAGLEIYQDDSNVLSLGRAYCDVCVGNGIYFDYSENGNFNDNNFAMTTTPGPATWLKVDRHANVYTGYVSMNGTDWTLVGTHTVTIAPTLVGLKASNQVSGDAEIPADFDYFTLVDNTNRVFLPLVMR